MAVFFGTDALSDKTIELLLGYIEEQKKRFAWGSNYFIWSPTLSVSSGAVLTHVLPDSIVEPIFCELYKRGKLYYLPKSRVMMFYAWFPGSSITWHSDYLDKSSMTIYLTKDWNPDHGGYFCWKEWGDDMPRHSFDRPPAVCQMRLPKFNEFVFMSDAEWHTTTITAYCAPPRLTLQMFFEKE